MGQNNAKMFPPPVPFGQTPGSPVLQQAQQVQMAPQQQFVDQNALANQAFFGAPQQSVVANQGINQGPAGKGQAFQNTFGGGRNRVLLNNID